MKTESTELVVKAVDYAVIAPNKQPEQWKYIAAIEKDMTALASFIADFENRKNKLQSELAKDNRFVQLKEYKQKIREAKKIHAKKTTEYNAAGCTLLADVPGADFNEKITNVRNNR